MNFKKLSKATQLSIISQLSNVKMQHSGFRNMFMSNADTVPTGLAGELKAHGLTNSVLLNPDGDTINLVVESKHISSAHAISTGIYSNNDYFNIGRQGMNAPDSKLFISFGCCLTQAEIERTGLVTGGINGRICIEEDDDLRDILNSVATYIGVHTANKEVLGLVLELIVAYDKAMDLPDALIERIANWTSIARIIDNLTYKMVHNYSNYYSDDENEDYVVPTPVGRNVFNVDRKFAKSGFTVSYDQHAQEYNGYQLDVEYTADSSLERGFLKVLLTYKGIDNINLGVATLTSGMSTDEILDTIVDALNHVKSNDVWGVIVTPLVDHAVEVIEEVKPFIVATLNQQ